MTISDENLKIYSKTISIERLKSFAHHNKNVITVKDLKEYYIANIMISQAFYPILSAIEISLRNAIDTTFKNILGNDWLKQEYYNNTILYPKDYDKLKIAYDKIKNTYGSNFSYGKVIAELHFGFWTNLCSKKYNSKIWTKKGFFTGVFENYPQSAQQQIHYIADKLNKIRNFRNRIFHYEPIIRDDYDIKCMYLLIEEVLNYLPKDNLEIIKNCSEFEKVYNKINKRFKNKKSRALYAKCIGRNSRLYIKYYNIFCSKISTLLEHIIKKDTTK